MKLEEGMYVRTDKGKIIKIEKLHKYEHDTILVNINGYLVNSLEITKASHNIIDLIEENDLVTLTSKYCERDIYRVEGKFREYISLDTLGDGTLIINNSKDIKSIVTKEQFESMSYKVKE